MALSPDSSASANPDAETSPCRFDPNPTSSRRNEQIKSRRPLHKPSQKRLSNLSHVEQEYDTVFDSWSLQFLAALTMGLVDEQARGSMRVELISLEEHLGTVIVVVEHYGNGDVPLSRRGYKLILDELRRISPGGDARAAAGLYLDDLASPGPMQDPPAEGDITWITRPGWMNPS